MIYVIARLDARRVTSVPKYTSTVRVVARLAALVREGALVCIGTLSRAVFVNEKLVHAAQRMVLRIFVDVVAERDL